MQTLKQGNLLQEGKYRIESILGQGGFGITYNAFQVALNRRVAIKEFFMKEYCERDADTSHVTLGTAGSMETVNRFKEKFMKEAALIAQFDNPHIVRIYDIFEENGTAYYVMEFLEDRWSQLGKEGTPWGLSLNIIRQIGDGLSYIHAQNVLHLDVKPSNILFRKDCAVLIDFGISKRYDAEGGQTSSTPVGISKGYAPLEQYNQGVQKFMPATDVYSLGATLYKLLTGKTPPEASEVNEDGIPPCPSNVPNYIWKAVETAMLPRKKDRPQSVAEFLALLVNDGKDEGINEEEKHNYSEEGTMVSIEPMAQPRPNIEPVSYDETIVSSIPPIIQKIENDMVYIEGGTFMMGSDDEEERNAPCDEKPAHPVTLSTFYLCKHEVTQEEWEAVMGYNPSYFKGSNYPVERVCWDECQLFINKLNSLTGQNYRLPTEAEWEYAARGGNMSQGHKYSGSDTLDDVAWYSNNNGGQPHPIMNKLPNELGLYDMNGNVWEWCQDWYGKEYYSSSPQTNPTGPSYGSSRVNRGGGWSVGARGCIVSYRNCDSPLIQDYRIGLRLAQYRSRTQEGKS